MKDTFFSTENCDRCGGSLKGQFRKMSWFTKDCLCQNCSKEEMRIKKVLEDKGVDTRSLEGCGQCPKLEEDE